MYKRKALVSAVLAVFVATTGSSAFADNNGRGNGNGNGRNDHNGRDFRDGDHDRRDFGRGHEEQRRHGRGVGPEHMYYVGDRLPYDYRHPHYVVNDWRAHQLSSPPRGYQWVQSGGDYVLVAIATGVILSLLLRN